MTSQVYYLWKLI